MKEIKDKIKTFLLKAIHFIFPLKVLLIKTKCLLDGCDQPLDIFVLTGKPFFTDTDLIDMLFKTQGQHLKSKHNVKAFVGLEFKSADYKYTFMGSHIEPEPKHYKNHNKRGFDFRDN